MARHQEVEELLKIDLLVFFSHTDLETFRRIWTVNKEQTKTKQKTVLALLARNTVLSTTCGTIVIYR